MYDQGAVPASPPPSTRYLDEGVRPSRKPEQAGRGPVGSHRCCVARETGGHQFALPGCRHSSMAVHTLEQTDPRTFSHAAFVLAAGDSHRFDLSVMDDPVLLHGERGKDCVWAWHARIISPVCDIRVLASYTHAICVPTTPKPGLLFDLPGSQGTDQLREIAGPLLLLGVDELLLDVLLIGRANGVPEDANRGGSVWSMR